MHPALQALFERHVAASFDKQLFLAELVGNKDWTLDLARGLLVFADGPTWHVQILGLVSARDGSWVWGWSPDVGAVAPGLVKAAQGMRRLGALRDIPELITPRISNGEAIGTRLAAVASGVFHANAFYRAPYEGGSAFLLIIDPDYPHNDTTPAVRIPTVLPQVLRRFPADHRRVLMGYVKDYGLSGHPNGEGLLIEDETGPVLRARFGPEGELTGLEPI